MAMAYYSNFSRRLIGTSSVSFLKFGVKSRSHSPLRNASPTMPLQCSFPSFSRASVYKLGCVQSLVPLHSVVATARMISYVSVDSRNCGTFPVGALCCSTQGRQNLCLFGYNLGIGRSTPFEPTSTVATEL